MKYRAEIDGLRALAVLPVILFHAGFESFSGGFIGVDVFFVISGYLITTIIISEMAEGKFSIIKFYERRARRILPALFFVMASSLPFAWLWLTPNDLIDFGNSLVAVSTFSSNILFWLDSGYFDISAELKPLLHTWSLAVEEQYYILFPIFLILTWRLGIQWILILLSIVFLVSLGIAQWGAYSSPSAVFFLLPSRGWELLIGVFAAFYLKHNTHLKSHITNQVLSLLGFGMIVSSIIMFDKTTPFPGLYALIPTIGTVLLILCAIPQTFIHRLLSLKFIVGIGLISYSAYLWHQPLLAFARHRFLGDVSELTLFVLCFASLVMAWFSWKFIEAPFRSELIISRKIIFIYSLIGMLFFTSFGLWIVCIDGGIKNYPINKQNVLSRFINPSDYVRKRHKMIRLKEFNKINGKGDILIIGDSHSEDLVNALYEGGLDRDFEFSSFYIPNRCNFPPIKELGLRDNVSAECAKISLEYKKLLNQMIEADQIFLISRWRNSHVEIIEESLKTISNINKNITLFSSKIIDAKGFRWYEKNDIKDWKNPPIDKDVLESIDELALVSNALEDIAASMGINFVNTQHLICNQNNFCSNFISEDIISYDGSHLTPHGAKILGDIIKDRLFENSISADFE